MRKNKVVVAVYDGAGGPARSQMAGDGFRAGPTDPGTYVLAYCGRHSSSRYAEWSRIRWGSPLKEEKGELWVKHEGRWQKLDRVTPVTRADILDYHEELYGTRKIPSEWVFNDFGHRTCYFFKDRDRNRRLDRGKEKIHGEFFHTTPRDEAAAAQGKPVILTESHGCIHVKPEDIDEMERSGYFRKGNLVVIHRYSDKPPAAAPRVGKAPYEVHFYPGAQKIVVLGTQK